MNLRRALVRATAVLLFTALSCACAEANSAIFIRGDSGSNSATATCVLSNAPVNGDVLSISRNVSATTTLTATDSNGLTFTTQAHVTGSTINSWIQDLLAQSSPTATITWTTAAASARYCATLGNAAIATRRIQTDSFAGTITPATSPITASVPAGSIGYCNQQNTAGTVPSQILIGGNATTDVSLGLVRIVYYIFTAPQVQVTCEADFSGTKTGAMAMVLYSPFDAPNFMQHKDCTTSVTCTFGSAPPAGDVVSIMYAAPYDLSGVSVTDSASNALTYRGETCAAANAICVAVWDYVVPGTVTASFTIHDLIAGGDNGNAWDIFAVAVPGQYSGATGTTSATATLSPGANDAQVCASYGTATSGAVVVNLSNGTNIDTSAADPYAWALAASTTSSTCSESSGFSAGTTLEYASYAHTAFTAFAPYNLGSGWLGYQPFYRQVSNR